MSWKEYYSRPYWLQDFEYRIIKPTMKLCGGVVREAIVTPEHGKNMAWYKEEEFGVLLRRLGESVLDDTWVLSAHINSFQKARKRLLVAVHACARAGERRAPSRVLLDVHKRLLDAHSEFVLFIWQPWSITFFLEEWFMNRLKERYPSEWESMNEVVACTSKAIQVQRMAEAVWKWKLHGEPLEQMKNIVQRFGYLAGYSANALPWKAEEIVQQAGEGDEAQRLREARLHRAKGRRAFDALHKRLKHEDVLLAKVAEVIHEYVWLRTERIDVLKKAFVYSAPFFRWVERMNNWEFGWSVHTTREELYGVLRGKVSLDREELRKRHEDGYVVHMTTERTRVITDTEEQKQFIAETIGIHDWRGEKEVRGHVACKGVVRGRVRVMFHTHEHVKMQPGEILVAHMTHPDYMAAIRKAAAIVTDEGGVVCHAAVISRELKIPCVIGTQNATKVFHDGDMVEVDADNGVVRKIDVGAGPTQ